MSILNLALWVIVGVIGLFLAFIVLLTVLKILNSVVAVKIITLAINAIDFVYGIIGDLFINLVWIIFDFKTYKGYYRGGKKWNHQKQ